ncbi:B-4DMT family transporter [Millisia brevis]|uniref:B-4DMT family transporter n=1 Tax=Millisia brevis TaxID=264148 RepID=UPI000AF5A59F|nr:B-4DMT family transporter [Millisia brevis]
MMAWLFRGLIMSGVHFGSRLLLALWLLQWPTSGGVLRWVALLIGIVVAGIWGVLDGVADRRRNPDPENGADLTMRWLKAGAFAALVSGVLCWVVSQVIRVGISQNSLFFELTSGAAFTVLLVFIPAVTGAAIGRWWVGRGQARDEAKAAREAENVTV